MTQSHPLIRIHGVLPYDRGAKARWLLTELGVPFESHWLTREELMAGSPAYLRLNPMGRIPTLEFGDQVIFESGAICAFLADHFADSALAPALNSPLRADYQKWMYFAASTLDPFQTRIMIIEDIPAGPVLSEKMEALVGEVRDAFGALEQALTHREYLIGGQFSAADICVSYHLYWLRLWPELKTLMDQSPRLTQYLDRIQTRKAAVEAKVFTYEEA